MATERYPQPTFDPNDIPDHLRRGLYARALRGDESTDGTYTVQYHTVAPAGTAGPTNYWLEGDTQLWDTQSLGQAVELARWLHDRYGSRTYVIRRPGNKMLWDSHRSPGVNAADGPSGEAIRAMRHARGWTQAEFARRIGTTVTTISRWERGARRPTGLYAEAVRRSAAAPENERDRP